MRTKHTKHILHRETIKDLEDVPESLVKELIKWLEGDNARKGIIIEAEMPHKESPIPGLFKREESRIEITVITRNLSFETESRVIAEMPDKYYLAPVSQQPTGW